MNKDNEAQAVSLYEWAEKRKHSRDLSPLSGHCPNKGAQRAASVDPFSSTGQGHSF